MKKFFWIFLLSFLYVTACRNPQSHSHDETTHTHENGDHDHGDGTHTHADGTTHADHNDQEEFTVDSLSQDSVRND